MGLLDTISNALPDFLPDDPYKRDAARMGLLAFGGQMLANSNKGFAPSLGSGLLSGATAYGASLKDGIDLAQKRQQAAWTAAAIKQINGDQTPAPSIAGAVAGSPPTDMTLGQYALAQGAKTGSIGPTVKNAGLLSDMEASPQGLLNPDGLTPASHMGGGAFYRAAAGAGLPTDNATLNRIVALVNGGMSPEQAAAQVAGKPAHGATLPPAGQGSGGVTPSAPRGLTLPMLQAGALLGMKNIEPLFNMYKYKNDGIERKPGTWYKDPVSGELTYTQDPSKGVTYDPVTNSVKPIAGYNENLADIASRTAGAQEHAKAENDLLPLDYVDKDGRPIGGTRAAYIDQFQKPPQSISPALSPLSFQGEDLFRQLPQPLQQRIISDAKKSGDPKASFSYQYPNGRMIRGAVDFSAAPGPASSLPGAMPAPGISPQSGPVLQSKPEQRQQLGEIDAHLDTRKKLNENWITSSYNPAIDAGRSAQQTLANLDAFKNIDLTTGWGTQAQAGAANLLSSLGVQKAENFVTNVQKFQSIAMDRLLTSLQAQKGPQTEGDSQRAQNTFVQLQNTPQANQFIADFARAKANQDARRAEFYKEALPIAQREGDLTTVDRQWSRIQGSIWNDSVLQKWRRK